MRKHHPSARCSATRACAIAAGLFAFGAAGTLFASPTLAGSAVAAASYLERPPEDEVIYFMLPDRFENGDPSNDAGGLEGDALRHGFDPSHKGFYHGGDLKGLTSRLDYIAGLGATAIWLGPIYKNKPVQGAPGQESAGYHGYWITDFTDVDPHFGTKDDLKAFVDAAHARGMKVYLDIITNHTADVIAYRECHDPDWPAAQRVEGECVYRSKADYPWTTKGGVRGEKINNGFLGDDAANQTPENFARLQRSDFAYTPFVPAGEENAKSPEWLNDVRFYHNRGHTTFEGENSLYGDFAGLDDLMTEDPRVVQGFIDIFKTWITDYKIDGFRVDTARHVNAEFWRAFIPAVVEHAKSEGIPNFFVFAEAYLFDVSALASLMHNSEFPSALDFPLNGAIREVALGKAAPTRLADLFAADVLYPGGFETARALPTFVGNHDMGRFAGEALRTLADAPEKELTARTLLAHALLFFTRGAPVIYSGSEQGFTGDGGDQDAREDMFASQVATYNDNVLLGTNATTAGSNFDTKHPIYRGIARMASVYREHPALRRGRQETRLAETEAGGLFVISRFDPDSGAEYVIAFNAGNQKRERNIEVAATSKRWRSVAGDCAGRSAAVGTYTVKAPAFGYTICRAVDAR